MSESNKSHFFKSMIQEADAYVSMDLIEGHVEKGLSLHHIPLQPLYIALKNLPLEQVAEYLPKLSDEQRQILKDLDLWEKDELDVKEFEYWIRSYALCLDDEIRSKFTQGAEFGLYLKGRFNIWTFDDEEPEYPEHDYYFLTDDHLLLFEFDEHNERIDDVQRLIRDLYASLGVEKAYAHLFKYVNEGHFSIVEEEYQLKKNRLIDAGFVDYYDGLQIDTPFTNLKLLNNYLKKKTKIEVGIDDFAKGQLLDRQALVAYRKGLSHIEDELSKVENSKRREFLQFNFIRLVNGTITIRSSLKEGSMALNRVGAKTRALLNLGFEYLKYSLKEGLITLEKKEDGGEDCLFDYYDFCEIYKIGNTLISLSKKDLKKSLTKSKISEKEEFLGTKISQFLDNLFDEPSKIENTDGEISEVITYENWKELNRQSQFIIELLPFVDTMFITIKDLIDQGGLADSFYLNYNIEEIDFESIMISSYANFLLGNLEKGDSSKKMGLTLDEYKNFLSKVIDRDPSLLSKSVPESIKGFQKAFGLSDLEFFSEYFYELLKSQMEGYEFSKMTDSEFEHVGGPIILNTQLLS